ncbi:unnamed protein product [Bursaphelenchus okinawaensis]|uniref:Uncharacterized protein n=1 Tax=Bursaphelenchus okinawaensis TaxID=465554 RepID=A0A811LNK8_9BILA|nr:unnamed protein product [Bursaphelenchus okinawaensis]CAG9127161.1 unnamed protein product [Bursaphelenchus okinawaensis]
MLRTRGRLAFFVTLIYVGYVTSAECDPKEFTKKENPESKTSYFYCNTDGTLAKRDCASGKEFNTTKGDCDFPAVNKMTPPPKIPVKDEPLKDDPLSPQKDSVEDLSPFLQPQFQAPDDICSGGVPLTKLGAPVACNPQIPSCPDGYACILYSRTGTSYCCQHTVEPSIQDSILCAGNQITFFEPLTGIPHACALNTPGSCPIGFGCNLVGGSLTRCCGRDFGCPLNSAGYVNPNTGSHVQCNLADPSTCPNGFVCTRSSMFNTAVCCSDTSTSPSDVCGGDPPLSQPNPCSASNPCPNGHSCKNGRCCPTKGMCPTGQPLGGITSCSDKNPCPNNYQCVTNNGAQYCCPAPEHVCNQPRDSGRQCAASGIPAMTRYYFDQTTGSCRAFQYSQCGGNANNFDSLEQCEGFCLDHQCPSGKGLKAGPAIATCSPSAFDSCPSHYSCLQPLFGSSYICCSNKESLCRDQPTAGESCFGTFMTIQRYRYNSDSGKCEPYQYYGCGGSGNNFITKEECQQSCQSTVLNACNGVAPMSEDGEYVKRCAPNVPCPKGSWCNTKGYCCPHAETSCNAPKSIGHTCLAQKPGTFWYYDSHDEVCMPFMYSGCGGTMNRFADRESCEQQCVHKLGECPRGMTPFLTKEGNQPCSPTSINSCPEGSSCVVSSTGEHICCSSTAQCPSNRLPYVIPGSDSHVACLPDDDNCPQGFQCVQSGTVSGFYMCCSNVGIRRLSSLSIMKQVQHMSPKCPSGLQSNGQRCTINEIEGCPVGYLCIGNGLRGVCCKTAPKCQKKKRPYYIAKKQVLTCSDDETGCPRGSSCSPSTVEGVDICCVRGQPTTTYSKVPKVVPKCKDGALPYFALGSRVPQQCTADRDDECPEEYECDMASDDQYYCCPAWDRCPADSTPFLVEGSRKPLGCNWMANNCPEGYSCEGSKDRAICCKSRPSSAQCPVGQSPFLYAKRPLVCPPNKKSCPAGYDCVAARNGGVNICCSALDHQSPECVTGYGYYDPKTNKNMLCDPEINSCPSGYSCKRSTMANAHVCCTNTDNRYDGYCPPSQVPYMPLNSIEPPTCHMALNPCPTSAAYQCVYSAEKQNSYCCAPVDTTSPNTANKFTPGPFRHYNRQPNSNPYANQAMPPRVEPMMNNMQPMNALPHLPQNLIPAPDMNNIMGHQLGQQVAQNLPNISPQGLMEIPNAAHIVASCPPWSKPLLNMQTKTAQACSTWNKCPSGFTCYSNYPDGRNAQCCTTVPLDNQTVFKATPVPPVNQMPAYSPPEETNPLNGEGDNEVKNVSVVIPALALPDNITLIRCPPGTVNISGVCKRMFFVGQQGCESNEQCNQRTNGTQCFKGYCACLDNKLIHESNCVQHCPEGFLNIAGRCHDLTTVVFMDSVDERANGTMGGFCLDTVVREEQCQVKNAYCNEKSITCQCKPGYELKLDFANKEDKGECIEVEGSKFKKADDPIRDEPEDIQPIRSFFVIDSAASDAPSDLSDASGTEPLDLAAPFSNETSIHVKLEQNDASTVEIITKA